MSNWELVNAKHSTNGHAIAVMGPQVGYYNPQILMEEDLHGPGIDARGASFPGVNLYVELGHGRDYAWSATTATADNVDTFAEVLCQDEFHYLYKGQCLPMEKLERDERVDAERVDQTPPGSRNADRLPHGARHRLRARQGQRQARRLRQRAHHLLPRGRLGDRLLRVQRTRLRARARSSSSSPRRTINFGFNWAYVDADHIAYYLSGWYPQRAAKDLARLPDPRHRANTTGRALTRNCTRANGSRFEAHPNAIDPTFLVSWNNKQAPRLRRGRRQVRLRLDLPHAADPQLHRSRSRRRAKRWRPTQLVSAMDEAATQDIRSVQLWPILKQALGSPSDPQLQAAIAELDSWYADGGHRRDLNNTSISEPGSYEHNEAITLMDAWWPKLLEAEFQPGARRRRRSASCAGCSNSAQPNPGGEPTAPDFADGWYGYVSKDLRDLLAAERRRRAPKGAVLAALLRRRLAAGLPPGAAGSLPQALSVTPQQIYGHGECAEDPQASCFDMNRFVSASGDLGAAVPVPEPPDVPAGRGADANARRAEPYALSRAAPSRGRAPVRPR